MQRKVSAVVLRVKSGEMSPERVERFKELWTEQNKGPAKWQAIIVRRSVIKNFRGYYSSTRTHGQRGRVYSFCNATRLTWRALVTTSERPRPAA